MLYYVISWCDLFPYQLPDHEDLCEEQRLMAKLVDLLKAEVTDQQYVVGIVQCVQWTGAVRITKMFKFMNYVYNSKTEGY